MRIAGKSHSQRDVLACSRRLRNSLFSATPRSLLLSFPTLENSLSFQVLGKYQDFFYSYNYFWMLACFYRLYQFLSALFYIFLMFGCKLNLILFKFIVIMGVVDFLLIIYFDSAACILFFRFEKIEILFWMLCFYLLQIF